MRTFIVKVIQLKITIFVLNFYFFSICTVNYKYMLISWIIQLETWRNYITKIKL